MNQFITFLILSLSYSTLAQGPAFEWAKSSGGDFCSGSSVIADNSGNVYTIGRFTGTVDFDPGAGSTNITSNGGLDIFIQKLDASGNFLWVKTFGGLFSELGYSIAIDNLGNIVTTGSFRGTVDFDPGAGTTNLTSNGAQDVFVQKIDPSGNFLWAKSFGGIDGDFPSSIITDGSGNIYTTGRFEGTADFNPDIGTFNLTANGDRDVFVHKLDVSGNFQWAKTFGGLGYDGGSSIAVDASGNIYTLGNFNESVDFDPGPGIASLTSNGSQDVFVQKMDASGNFQWAKTFGGTDFDGGSSIAVDASGNILTSGRFRDIVDFDPGAGTANRTSNGNGDVFVQKLNSTGDFQWVQSFGGANDEESTSIALDGMGNIYTTGIFYNTVDFDPGIGVTNLTSNGGLDPFVQKIDGTGSFQWARSFGGSDNVRTFSIAVDVSNNIYTTGEFTGTADFNPGTASSTLTSNGGANFFVQKMSPCVTITGTDTRTECDSYSWIDGNTYTSNNNTATWTLTNSVGCDSVVTLDLTITNSNTGTDVQTACDSYTWIDSNTYTSSNNSATWTLTNQAGCDSVVTLALTITNSSSGTDVQTACDNYTWIDGNTYTSSNNSATWTLTNAAGCDSVVTLDLTITNSNTGTDVHTACDSYTWIDGNTYTSSNNSATWTLTNQAG